MFLEGFHELNELLPANERLSLMSYAQLSNHQHLFVRNGLSEWAITKLMHRLCTQYGMEFNWLHGRRGKVFQRPFRGKIIRSADHIASTFVYIHLNPDA